MPTPITSDDSGGIVSRDAPSPTLEVTLSNPIGPVLLEDDMIPLDKVEDIEHDLMLPQSAVSVWKGGPLDICLCAYESMCEAGRYDDPVLLRFEQGALPQALEKLLTFEHVSSWQSNVLVRHRPWKRYEVSVSLKSLVDTLTSMFAYLDSLPFKGNILDMLKRLVHVIAIRMGQDVFSLLNILHLVRSPSL